MNRSQFATLLLLTTLATTLTTTAFATDRYVAPSGTDSTSSGSILTPYKTISYGFSRMQPGDTLYVRGGTYNETLTIWGKCDSLARWYSIEEYTGETAIIDGTGKGGNGVVVIGGSSTPSCYVRIKGFEIRNGGSDGILLYNAHHVELLKNDVHDNHERGISVASADSSPFGTTHDVLVQENLVHHNVKENQFLDASQWQQGLSTLRADQVDIIGNDVYENWGEGIDAILSDHVDIVNNRSWDNFSVNIYLDNAQYSLVDRNFVMSGKASTPTAYYRDDEPAHGIYIANETYTTYGQNRCTDLTITNNIVRGTNLGIAYSNGGAGGGLHNTLIANNTVVETVNLLYWVENGTTNVHDTTVVENNIFYAASGANYAYANSSGITYLSNCWWNGTSSSRKTSTTDVNADPELVNVSGSNREDYKIASTSDCIDAGTTVSTILHDHFGTSRSGVFDIGAHEWTP
jgi:nitrous oxidase accessory protein NosD